MNPEHMLFALALGIKEPMKVINIVFNENQELHIHLGYDKMSQLECPECNELCSCYDAKDKTWRHLNFFQYKAYIHLKTPRIKCEKHGIKQIDIPWAKSGIGFTLLFEAFVMTLVRSEMTFKSVAELVQTSDKNVFAIYKKKC